MSELGSIESEGQEKKAPDLGTPQELMEQSQEDETLEEERASDSGTDSSSMASDEEEMEEFRKDVTPEEKEDKLLGPWYYKNLRNTIGPQNTIWQYTTERTRLFFELTSFQTRPGTHYSIDIVIRNPNESLDMQRDITLFYAMLGESASHLLQKHFNYTLTAEMVEEQKLCCFVRVRHNNKSTPVAQVLVGMTTVTDADGSGASLVPLIKDFIVDDSYHKKGIEQYMVRHLGYIFLHNCKAQIHIKEDDAAMRELVQDQYNLMEIKDGVCRYELRNYGYKKSIEWLLGNDKAGRRFRKRQIRLTVIAMAFHPRLGSASPLRVLAEAFEVIAMYVK
jgi:hypothetical protein